MSNAAAAQGLSAALAPPPPLPSRGSGSGGSGGGGGRIGQPSPGGRAGPHGMSVSLAKAWLEILVKLLRRSGTGSSDALQDADTREALMVLFERTAAGVGAAAVTAAIASTPSAASAAASPACSTPQPAMEEGARRKGLGWADSALVLRVFVLLREVLVRAPNAFVVPLRRRGVLHRYWKHAQHASP